MPTFSNTCNKANQDVCHTFIQRLHQLSRTKDKGLYSTDRKNTQERCNWRQNEQNAKSKASATLTSPSIPNVLLLVEIVRGIANPRACWHRHGPPNNLRREPRHQKQSQHQDSNIRSRRHRSIPRPLPTRLRPGIHDTDCPQSPTWSFRSEIHFQS